MYIYISAILIVGLMIIITYNSLLTKKRKQEGVNFNKFESKIYDLFYRLSFMFPFNQFVEDDKNIISKQGIKIERQLNEAGLNEKFSVRSFMSLKSVMLFCSFVLYLLIELIIFNSSFLSKIFLNINISTPQITVQIVCLPLAFCLLLTLIPSFRIFQLIRKSRVTNTKDIPVLQMFIILMLKSGKTVSETLLAMTKVNTVHRKTFKQGYRIFVRDNHEGMEYLKNNFKGTKFSETFSIMEDIGEYSKDNCISILESNQKNINEDFHNIKRKNDTMELIYSQISVVAPFSALLVLGAVPIVVMSLALISNSGLM